MKKKLFISTVVLLLAMLPMMSQQSKYYSESANGYGGFAMAQYLGTTKTCDLSYYDSEDFIYDMAEFLEEEKDCVMTRQLSNLSKEEVFLIWKALGEYNVRDKEVYSVRVLCGKSIEALDLVVEIRDKGKNFRYYGGYYYKVK